LLDMGLSVHLPALPVSIQRNGHFMRASY